MFVFSALLEFALVNYIYLLDIRVRPSKQTGTKSVYATTEPSSMDVSNNSFVPGEYKPKTDIFAVKYDSSSAATKNGIANNAGETFKPYVQYAQRIDRISRVVFPLLFTFFNVLFWSIYLHEPTN
uniref:Gamma-aminobutyric acid receptor subunit alpha-5-like n=1 Tax=Saccoglossus kowalevskii TaxID=10224 RepID=A0ABM0LYF1_SACKO|nr:PREDICTED: gamma-aminobutyric acid receptor subunit alpha-5-like [Saccoglossus kowalevskii]